MNICKFIDCWESEISDLVLKYYNFKSSEGLERLTKVFFYIYRITPKFNFLNREKMFEKFYSSLNDCVVSNEHEIKEFYKNVCKEFFGIKKNWKKSKIQFYIEKIIGFEK